MALALALREVVAMTDSVPASESVVFTPPRAHFCRMPQVERTMIPPPFDEDDTDREPVTWLDIPDAGSVWRCPECGATWKVRPPRYANVLMCEWHRCSRWTYRRGVRQATANASSGQSS